MSDPQPDPDCPHCEGSGNCRDCWGDTSPPIGGCRTCYPYAPGWCPECAGRELVERLS